MHLLSPAKKNLMYDFEDKSTVTSAYGIKTINWVSMLESFDLS